MNRALAILILFLSAALESGGDAVMRAGLHSHGFSPRLLRFLAGAALLAGYGLLVNSPRWDFGRLLGIYVVFFFVLAQIIAWGFFHTAPSRSILAGGTLIVLGGVIITLGRF